MSDPLSPADASAAPKIEPERRVPGPPGPPRAGERRRRVIGWRSRDVLRAAALIAGMYIGLKLVWLASPLILTAFLGILFGLAVEAGVDKLARWRIPRGLGAAAIVLGFYGLLIGLGAWMAPTLREQAGELRSKLPQAVDKVESWINKNQSGFFGVVLGGSEITGTTPTAGTPTPETPQQDTATSLSSPRTPQDSARAQATRGEGPPSTLRNRIGGQFSGVTRYLFPFLTSTFTVFAGVLLITFLAIYIGADPDTYHRGLMHLFPHRARDRAGEVLSAMATVLRRWLVTQLIAMVAIGVVTTGVLLLLGVKAAFALGIIAGLLEFVPTIGPLLSAIPAVAMGFLDSPEKAFYVMLAYIGIQFVENHLLIPLLMKGSIDLPPALTIMGQALMALVFGFLGLLVAVPAIAAVMVSIKMLYVEDVVGDDIEIMGENDDD
ncbi:MAG: AI-2E family transporter [Anaerolineae bacterium]|nr:AI-2E family transporter [Gemmatimonadaceae bacterium]